MLHTLRKRFANNNSRLERILQKESMAKREDEESTPETVRSPRHPRTQRSNLAGLDLDPEEGDEEYHEDNDESVVNEEDGDDAERAPEREADDDDEEMDEDDAEEAGDDDDDEDVDEEDVVPVKRGRRGRKRKAATDDPEDEGGDEQSNKDDETKDAEVKKEEENGDAPAEVPEKKKGKKRGRKPKIPRPEDVYFDDKGNEINIKNDEVVLDDEDPKGCEKIDENGFLQGDRKFKIKTFTLLGKGERQYMVSTEPARLVGFRDSYLLFKTHLSLFKKVCTHEEKMDLIQRHLIPTSYKGRSVNLVTARSIFREFGARMVVGGKKVTDDFWEEKARERGDVEGEFADAEEGMMKSGHYGTGDHSLYLAQVTGSALINYQADPTWMYQVSLQTLEYNKQLTEARNQVWLRGVKDTYSGFNFYPTASQPHRAKFAKLAEAQDETSIDCSIHLYNPDIRGRVTGLASVPAEVFEDLDDPELKHAILQQQNYEKAYAK